MHEFSLCQSIVESVITELSQTTPAPKKVLEIKIKAGQLRQIIPDHMQFAFDTLKKDTILESATLIIDPVPILVKCRDCSNEQTIDAFRFACSNCGSTSLDTLTGMELYLDSIEVES